MSIGSFLATAGDIGEGIETYQTESAKRRLLRQQAELAQAELARQEQQRKLLQEAAAANVGMLPHTAGVLTPSAGLNAPAEILPAIAPLNIQPVAGDELTTTGGAAEAPPVKPKAGVAKPPAVGRVIKMGNTVIPWFDPNQPDRLNAGIGGFRYVDPSKSNVQIAYQARENERKLSNTLEAMAVQTKVPLGVVHKQFLPQNEKAELEVSQQASAWYQTDDARAYFRRNPQVLELAQKAPVKFFKGLVKANELAARQRAGVAAPEKTAPQMQPEKVSTTGVMSSSLHGPAASTKGAKAFDAQGKEYAGVVQQAAQRFGVDPIILNRLLASESHFNPNIVNPDSGALGMAQIMPDHINRGLVTEAQARDPVYAINFAAAHLAQNLRNEGGDYRKALLRYKGALSPRGVSAMTPVVRDITSGFQWDANQVLSAVGPKPTKSRDPATNAVAALQGAYTAGSGATGTQQAGVTLAGTAPASEPALNLTDLNTYMGNPEKIAPSMTYTQAQRDFAYRQAQIFAQTGNIAGYEETVAKLQLLDANLARLQGAQAILEIQNFNNPQRAEQLLSYLSGGRLQVKMRQDGRFAFFGANRQGQFVPIPGQENVSRDSFLSTLRAASDESYRARLEESATAAAQAQQKYLQEREMMRFKGQIEGELQAQRLQVDLGKAVLDARAQLEAAKLKGKGVASVAVGDENWLTYDDPRTGQQVLARPTEVTLPSGEVESTLDARPLSQWGGGK